MTFGIDFCSNIYYAFVRTKIGGEQLSPRTGRPFKDGKRKEDRITFRASEQDSSKIEFCCAETGLSKSEVIRKGVNNLYEQLKKGKK